MNQDEQHAEERARQAYAAWQEAQARRIRVADRAARLALELQRANQKLERKTHQRAEHLARLKRELEARALAARTAFARRVSLHQEKIELVRLPVRRPLPRYVPPVMIAMTVFASMVSSEPAREPRAVVPVVQQQADESLTLKLSPTLSLRRIP